MPSPGKNSRPSGLLVALVVIGALYFARVVFIPLALALLFSLVLTPIVSFLEKLKLPRLLAISVVVCTLLGLIGFGGYQISRQVVDLTQQLPEYKDTLEEKINSLRGIKSQGLNQATDTVHQLEKDLVAATPGSDLATDSKAGGAPLGSSPSKPMAVQLVPSANPLESVQNLLGPLATTAAIVVFTIFILAGRSDLRNRFIRLASGGRLSVMTQALDDATHRINRYLLLQLLVNSCYGAAIATALHFVGIPNASLWGLSAGILRFLPYVGPPLAAAMPILLSLAAFSGWQHALETMGIFFVFEFTVAHFIEPLLYGRHLGLSGLAVLVAAVFWTLIWGFPGLLLSTPLTVCLVVMGRYVPGLGFLSILLGDEPVLAPHVQYYQRLLAADPIEARQILEQCLKEKSLEELYGAVVVPALTLAKQDRHRNELDDDTQNFIYQTTREILDEIEEPEAENLAEHSAEDQEASESAIQRATRSSVVCIPAREGADDLAATLLSRLLERRGHNSKCVPAGPIDAMTAQIADANPESLCILALPPFALNHARGLYAKLRTHFPNIRTIICLWHSADDPHASAARLRLAGQDAVLRTFPEVLDHISPAAPALVPAAQLR